eukprot:TRINITY_DN92715_c0_g1_i1.p1 TRINITY_DN92715_c0_g1~~TRINITY_DN92715_c0_g1_i1.p1  ORF type:complete len:166 (-),score=24.25 TRINITY_DN92715_c0_g1_i1:38-535(-)
MVTASQFRRPLFKAIRRIEIDGWHRIGNAGTSSAFLRGVADDLLASAGGWPIPSADRRTSIAMASGKSPGGPGGHRSFQGDRAYWFQRPDLPGTFDAGLTVVRRSSHSARLVLGLFEQNEEEPSLLYAADRISVDDAGRQCPSTPELEKALSVVEAGFVGGKFGL